MTTKFTDIENIKKHLNKDWDVYSAVNVWYMAHHHISIKEFLNCSECWNTNELLDILNDKIKILTYARDEIEIYKNEVVK